MMQHSKSVVRRICVTLLPKRTARIQNFCCTAAKAASYKVVENTSDLSLPEPELDLDFLCDPKHQSLISENIRRRRGAGNLRNLVKLNECLKSGDASLPPQEMEQVRSLLNKEAMMLPNLTHPTVFNYNENKVLEVYGAKPDFKFPPMELHELMSKLGLLRTLNLGKITGRKTYYLTGALARLEQALIHYTTSHLLKRGFTLVSVPDLLHPALIEGCGMPTKGKRTQVYTLDPQHGSVCLSGTAEMALAGLFCNNTLQAASLPQKLAAVSRCFRAEVTKTAEERGIFRVHQFTKVEMFAVTKGEDGSASNDMLDEFVSIQRDLFSRLGLHFQVVDMAPNELGNPAYRKLDIEAWMPGRDIFGEVSSASNCTDYQSRRLGIKYKTAAGEIRPTHTVNGTACAVPRMLIALTEMNQQADGSVIIPEALQPFTQNMKIIQDNQGPQVKWISNKSQLV